MSNQPDHQSRRTGSDSLSSALCASALFSPCLSSSSLLLCSSDPLLPLPRHRISSLIAAPGRSSTHLAKLARKSTGRPDQTSNSSSSTPGLPDSRPTARVPAPPAGFSQIGHAMHRPPAASARRTQRALSLPFAAFPCTFSAFRYVSTALTAGKIGDHGGERQRKATHKAARRCAILFERQRFCASEPAFCFLLSPLLMSLRRHGEGSVSKVQGKASVFGVNALLSGAKGGVFRAARPAFGRGLRSALYNWPAKIEHWPADSNGFFNGKQGTVHNTAVLSVIYLSFENRTANAQFWPANCKEHS